MDNDSLTAVVVAGVVAFLGKIVWDWFKNKNSNGNKIIKQQLLDIREKIAKIDGIEISIAKIETVIENIKEDIRDIKSRS